MYPNINTPDKSKQDTTFALPPDDSQLAARWIEAHPQTFFYKGKYYRPGINGYVEIEKDIIKQEIYETLLLAVPEGCKVNKHRLSSVMELARIEIVITIIGGVK